MTMARLLRATEMWQLLALSGSGLLFTVALLLACLGGSGAPDSDDLIGVVQFGVVSLVVTAWFVHRVWTVRYFFLHGIQVEGWVRKHGLESGTEGPTWSVVEIEYTYGARRRRGKVTFLPSRAFGHIGVGSSVTVLVDPRRPERILMRDLYA